MSDLFEEDDLLEGEVFLNSEDEVIDIDKEEAPALDARRELERKFEEMRLRRELDDFLDY